MSQVVPVVTANGTLAHPVKQGAVWQYNGQPIQLTLPECDPAEDFNDGLTVAAYLVGLMFIAFTIKTVIRLFWKVDTGSDHDE